MDELKFNAGNDENGWRTPSFRQSVVQKIYEFIQKSNLPTTKNSIEMENHVFQKAKSKEEYLGMVARLIIHFKDLSQKKGGFQQQQQQQQQGGPQQGGIDQPGGGQQQGQGPQGQMQGQQQQQQPNIVPGAQNQLGPQGAMNQQQGPSMQQQQQQQQQNMPITATNLLQTLNQRPMASMQQQMQNKMGGPGGMGMMGGPGQGPMGVGGGMMGGPGQMGMNPMGGPQGMPGQMPNQGMGGGGGGGPMGQQMQPGNPMAAQMVQNQMNANMGGQMMLPNQMAAQMGNQMNMMHMQQRKPGDGMNPIMGPGGPNFQPGAPRGPNPGQFLGQSPSPSAPSPAAMGGPSPASMGGGMSGPMPSPMSLGGSGLGVGAGGPVGGVASPALVPSPSSHHPQQQAHPQHMQQHQRSVGMAPSPSSSLNTPLGAGAAPSPSGGGDDHVYREKVRQLSKYIDPLRKMIDRMVSDGENVEKLTKMKNLLDILSHPSKRMPLETLLKCEVVLEKLDFKRGEGMSLQSQPNPLHLQGIKEHQIFNPLLEVVSNTLQSPVANHTLERTFGPCIEALCGPEIRHMPPPFKKQKLTETPPDIPDVLQGEIARLDSRFKVSLEGLQVITATGAIRLVAQLEDSKLPCVPPMTVSVPRNYPAVAPCCLLSQGNYGSTPFLRRVGAALSDRLAAMPGKFSLSQLLDTWEMSVRQACNPLPAVTQHTETTLLMGM